MAFSAANGGPHYPPYYHSNSSSAATGSGYFEGSDGTDTEGSDHLSFCCGETPGSPPPGVEIFVGGLTRASSAEMLYDWFCHLGEITEVRVARDKRRRRCRGYGFVRFRNSEQANLAIEAMQGYQFKKGCYLGMLPSDENRTLYVSGMCQSWSQDQVHAYFSANFEGVKSMQLVWDRETPSRLRPFCFVEFDTHEHATSVHARYHPDSDRGSSDSPIPTAGASNCTTATLSASSAPPSDSTTTTPSPTLRPAAAAIAAAVDAAAGDCGGSDGGDGASAGGGDSGGGDGGSGGGGGDDAAGSGSGLVRPSSCSSGSSSCSSSGSAAAVSAFTMAPPHDVTAAAAAAAAAPAVSAAAAPASPASLNVEWADPLRYFIHLYGGVNRHTMQTRGALRTIKPAATGSAAAAVQTAAAALAAGAAHAQQRQFQQQQQPSQQQQQYLRSNIPGARGSASGGSGHFNSNAASLPPMVGGMYAHEASQYAALQQQQRLRQALLLRQQQEWAAAAAAADALPPPYYPSTRPPHAYAHSSGGGSDGDVSARLAALRLEDHYALHSHQSIDALEARAAATAAAVAAGSHRDRVETDALRRAYLLRARSDAATAGSRPLLPSAAAATTARPPNSAAAAAAAEAAAAAMDEAALLRALAASRARGAAAAAAAAMAATAAPDGSFARDYTQRGDGAPAPADAFGFSYESRSGGGGATAAAAHGIGGSEHARRTPPPPGLHPSQRRQQQQQPDGFSWGGTQSWTWPFAGGAADDVGAARPARAVVTPGAAAGGAMASGAYDAFAGAPSGSFDALHALQQQQQQRRHMLATPSSPPDQGHAPVFAPPPLLRQPSADAEGAWHAQLAMGGDANAANAEDAERLSDYDAWRLRN